MTQRISSARLFVMLITFLGFLSVVNPVSAKVGTVSTWLGKLYVGDGGDANLATLDTPRGFAADSACTLFIADTTNHVIRKIDGSTNIISTFAGSGVYGIDNGTKAKSTWRLPVDIAIGPSGELYIVDSNNPFLRRIADGQVTNWISGLHNPIGVTADGTALYISDTAANRVLKGSTNATATTVLTSGIVAPSKLVVGSSVLYILYNNGTSFGSINLSTGLLTSLKTDFVNADGLEVHNGLVYIVSGLHGVLNEISTYNPNGSIFTTIKSVYETEWYNHASDITFCGASMRLLFSGGSSVFRADENGASEVKIAGVTRWNDADGLRSVARVGRPFLMTLTSDKLKMFLFANQHLKIFDVKKNTLSSITGGQADNYVDGPADIARVSGPSQMVVSPKNTIIYIADRNNNRIRAYNRNTKVMSTLTGAGEVNAFAGTRNAYVEGGPCTTTSLSVAGCAYFDRPMGLAISRNGKTLYVADSDNHRIRTVNIANGATALLAGTGKPGLRDGAAKNAQFRRPVSLLLSTDGKTLYVVEWGNHAVRAINLTTKRVSTVVGNGKAGYLDGNLNIGRLSTPNFLAQGPKNILYLSEGGSLRIRVINLVTKKISTLAGSGKKGSKNGAASVAQFTNPRQLVMLNSKTLLVADDSNDMIRAISLK